MITKGVINMRLYINKYKYPVRFIVALSLAK